MYFQRTADEWELFIGEQLKGIRLGKNVRRQEVAQRAGVAVSSIARLEAGEGSKLSTVIKVAQVLEQENWLQNLAPAVQVSPIYRTRAKKERRRAAAGRPSQAITVLLDWDTSKDIPEDAPAEPKSLTLEGLLKQSNNTDQID